jgi:hypothetical protein
MCLASPRLASAEFEPAILVSSGKHNKHYTTEATSRTISYNGFNGLTCVLQWYMKVPAVCYQRNEPQYERTAEVHDRATHTTAGCASRLDREAVDSRYGLS